MPQYLKKVTPEYARKNYGVNVIEGSTATAQFEDLNVVRFTTGDGAVVNEIKDQQPPQSNGSKLF